MRLLLEFIILGTGQLKGHKLLSLKIILEQLQTARWVIHQLKEARILPFIYGIFFRIVGLPERCNTSVKSKVAMMQLLHTLFVLISMLMSKRNIAGQIIHEHVKIFYQLVIDSVEVIFIRKILHFGQTLATFQHFLIWGVRLIDLGPFVYTGRAHERDISRS